MVVEKLGGDEKTVKAYFSDTETACRSEQSERFILDREAHPFINSSTFPDLTASTFVQSTNSLPF